MKKKKVIFNAGHPNDPKAYPEPETTHTQPKIQKVSTGGTSRTYQVDQQDDVELLQDYVEDIYAEKQDTRKYGHEKRG